MPSENKKKTANRFSKVEQLRGKLLRTVACSGGHIEFQLNLNPFHKTRFSKKKSKI